MLHCVGSSMLTARGGFRASWRKQQKRLLSVLTPEPKTDKVESVSDYKNPKAASKSKIDKDNKLVSQVFNALSQSEKENLFLPQTLEKLLRSVERDDFTYSEALVTMSSIADELNLTSDTYLPLLKEDPRFDKLCKIVAKTIDTKDSQRGALKKHQNKPKPETDDDMLIPNVSNASHGIFSEFVRPQHPSNNFNDLSFIMELPKTQQAIHVVSKMSVPDTILAMSKLAQQRKRNIPLLAAMTNLLLHDSQLIDIKQSSDILYSMAMLNYLNEPLMNKICSHLQLSIPTNKTSAMIGSIATSLGKLRFLNASIMNKLTEWAIYNMKLLRSQDLCSILLTLATIGYRPDNFDKFIEVVVSPLDETCMPSETSWLNTVWSLVILNHLDEKRVASVFEEKFIKHLFFENLSVPKSLRLMNINSAAKHLMNDFSSKESNVLSSLLNSSPVPKSKDKLYMVEVLSATLLHLLPSSKCMKVDVDTRLGFSIDIVLHLSKSEGLIPVDVKKESPDVKRIAIMVQEYRAFTRGERKLLGTDEFYNKLLKKLGYEVLDVPYYEFNCQDQLNNRVSYMKQKIQEISVK